MKIRKVSILNLNSLRSPVDIDFIHPPLANTGLFAITGDTGAGKSTILDAITLALYGRIHRNKDVREAMSYGAAESLAEVEFESKGRVYRARWTLWRSHKKLDGVFQTPGRELALWKEESAAFEILATRSREVDQLVEEATGLDYDRFCRSVLLSQGDFAAFLMAGEKERSDLLERITGTEIYSELSKAAYQRHKLELEKLEDLKREREAMRMLSEEEAETLRAELTQRQQEAVERKTEMDTIREQTDWLLRLEKLENRLAAMNEREQTVQKQIETRQADFERLELARRAAPLREDLLKWRETARLQEETDRDIEKNSTAIAAQRTALNGVRDRLQIERTNLTEQKERRTALEKIFAEVTALDIRIREKELPLGVLLQEQQERSERSRALREQWRNLEQLQQSLTAAQEKRRAWLSERQGLQSLEQHEPLIRHQYRQWREYTVQMERLRRDIDQCAQDVARLQQEEQTVGERLERLQTDLSQRQENFRKKAPDHFALDRGELLGKLYREIEQLASEQQSLQAIEQIAREYQGLLTEQNEMEQRLEDLQREELALSKRILSATETLENWNKQVKFKQSVYEQQQLIANYEKDRHNLVEGEPCPLCFATEHPFRTQHFEPFVDRARLELEQARKKAEHIQQRYRQLLERHTELSLEIQHLTGNELKAVRGQLRQRYDKILGFEERLALILPDMALGELPDIWGQSLRERTRESFRLLGQRRQERDELSALDQELKQREDELTQLREKQRENLAALRVLKEKQRTDREQLDQWQEKTRSTTADLEKLLQPYGLTFQPDRMELIITDLGAQLQEFRAQSETYRTQQGEGRLNQQQLEQWQIQLNQLSEEEAVLTARLETEEKRLTDLRSQRRELFGDREPEQERAQINRAIDDREQRLALIEREQGEMEREIAASERLLSDKKQTVEQLLLRAAGLRKKLAVLARENGFETLEDLENAMLAHDELERLAASLQGLQQELADARQWQREIAQEIREERDKAMTDKTWPELQAQLTEQEQAFVTANRRQGALQEALREHAHKEKIAADLLASMEAQQKSYLRWAKLNDVIGMADGKKFRVFAQGLTLKKLVYLANIHLQRLNGRYLIEKNAEEDLGLNIVDTFQADNRRSMNTLSGGERFLVSLAMALGLSDLAGKDTRIESLFIDEGFGSLDDNSLDLALDTLENLQAQGKNIGIISHVKALKERIAVQIQVRKKGSGFSDVAIVA